MEYLKTGLTDLSQDLITPKEIHLYFFLNTLEFSLSRYICVRIYNPHQVNTSSAWQESLADQWSLPSAGKIFNLLAILCAVCLSEVPKLIRCNIVHRHLPSNAPLRGSSTLRGIWPIRARAALRYCFWSSRWSNELFHSLSV